MNNLVQIHNNNDLKSRKRNIHVQDAGDVKRLMNKVINELRQGEIDSKSANAIGYLANIILKTIELGELEQQISYIQNRVAELEKS